MKPDKPGAGSREEIVFSDKRKGNTSYLKWLGRVPQVRDPK